MSVPINCFVLVAVFATAMFSTGQVLGCIALLSTTLIASSTAIDLFMIMEARKRDS